MSPSGKWYPLPAAARVHQWQRQQLAQPRDLDETSGKRSAVATIRPVRRPGRRGRRLDRRPPAVGPSAGGCDRADRAACHRRRDRIRHASLEHPAHPRVPGAEPCRAGTADRGSQCVMTQPAQPATPERAPGRVDERGDAPRVPRAGCRRPRERRVAGGRAVPPPAHAVRSPGLPGRASGAGRDRGATASHYFDSRGVHRIYQLSFDDGVWRLWRDEPGFNQRFAGTFEDDGNRMVGLWEASEDGSRWEHDLGITFVRRHG